MFENLFKDDRDPVFIKIEKQEKKQKLENKELVDRTQLYTESFNILLYDFNSFKNSDLELIDKQNTLSNLLNFFIEKEDYKKCIRIKEFINMLN
jgi:hypothetical protein